MCLAYQNDFLVLGPYPGLGLQFSTTHSYCKQIHNSIFRTLNSGLRGPRKCKRESPPGPPSQSPPCPGKPRTVRRRLRGGKKWVAGWRGWQVRDFNQQLPQWLYREGKVKRDSELLRTNWTTAALERTQRARHGGVCLVIPAMGRLRQ
jgi:hypothetical protein